MIRFAEFSYLSNKTIFLDFFEYNISRSNIFLAKNGASQYNATSPKSLNSTSSNVGINVNEGKWILNRSIGNIQEMVSGYANENAYLFGCSLPIIKP